MNNDKIRGIIAIIITIGTLLVAGILALEEVFTGQSTNLEVLKNWSALWSGILGVIIGYYFGKKD